MKNLFMAVLLRVLRYFCVFCVRKPAFWKSAFCILVAVLPF